MENVYTHKYTCDLLRLDEHKIAPNSFRMEFIKSINIPGYTFFLPLPTKRLFCAKLNCHSYLAEIGMEME